MFVCNTKHNDVGQEAIAVTLEEIGHKYNELKWKHNHNPC